MIRLIIDGAEADLEQKAFTYTLQVNDMFDFDTREVSYSETIYLPITSGNRSIFGFADVPTIEDKGAYKQYNVDYYVNGVPIVQGGQGYLIGSRGNYFIFEFKESSKKLYQFLQNRDIKGLKDLLDGDNYKSGSIIQDSHNNGRVDNIMYLLADYGDDSLSDLGSNGILWNIQRSPLSISLRRVLKLIAKEGGFIFKGDFLEDEIFKNSYICSSNIKYEEKQEDTFTAAHNERFGIHMAPRHNLWGFPPIPNGNGYGIQLYEGVYSPTVLPYKILNNGYYRVNINIKKVHGIVDGHAWFGILSSSLGGKEDDLNIYDGHTWDDMSYQFDIYGQKGDEIFLSMRADKYSTVEVEGVTFKIEKLAQNNDLQTLVSDFSLIDLFRNMFKIFSITPMYNSKTGEYWFYTLSERVNTDNVLNWTGKFVKVKEVKFHSQNYAKKNNFLYKKYDDNNGHIQEDWDGRLFFEDETLADRKDFAVGFYAPKNKRLAINNVGLERMEFFAKEEKVENGQTKIEYKEKTGRWHIFLRKRLPVDAVVIEVGGKRYGISKVWAADGEPYKWNTLLSSFYKDLPRLMEHPYIVTAEFALSEIDIYEFSFFSRIYVEQLGCYFLPNKIKYKAGALAEVEMIKIS